MPTPTDVVPLSPVEEESIEVVENETSGLNAKPSEGCHTTPTEAGYPIVKPVRPRSCAFAARLGTSDTDKTSNNIVIHLFIALPPDD